VEFFYADAKLDYNPPHTGGDTMATKKAKKAPARKRAMKDLAPKKAAAVKAGVRKAGDKPLEY